MLTQHYTGVRVPNQGNRVIRWADGGGEPLDPRLDLWSHSPDGFNWGYGGSGPAQLAIALLADALADDGLAVVLYQRFKADVIAKLDMPVWSMSREYIWGKCLSYCSDILEGLDVVVLHEEVTDDEQR